MAAPDLNASQRDAVKTLSGPLLVLAGAGSGKTRVITYRIAELIKHGTTPSRILAVTFTNKAAREMRERATKILGRRSKGAKRPEISTFHSLCVRILRRNIRRLGYPEEFAIYDRGDQESLARNALRDIRVGHQKLKPADLLNQIGTWKNLGVRPKQALELAKDDDKLQLAAMAYARYQTALKACGAVDFDDLLLCTEQLFEEFAEVRFAESSRFEHLLIDEYQDTNGIQYRIVKTLAERHRNLCVVGDDDQAIYAWRGADVSHILSFQKDWPEAKVVRLEENYRSREPILALANTLIAHNSSRHQKVLRACRGGGSPPRFIRYDDEVLEAESTVRDIRQKLESLEPPRITASDIAILCRTNEQPRAFELELRRAKIPYVLIGGMSFYDRKEIRDVLSYLKVLANPKDEVALLRIINTPPRGIGASTVQSLLEVAVKQGVSLWEILRTAQAHAELSPATNDSIQKFGKVLDEQRSKLGSVPLSALITELVQAVDYRAEVERAYKTPADVEARWESVQSLVNAAAQYETRSEMPSLLGFLEEATLSGREEQKEDDRKVHSLTLMTLHSAKGLEFPHVYMVGMEEGILPHQRSIADGSQNIAEERRLCYVGVTRAQETLTLSMCKARMKWGKLRPSIPSRFLMEMRGDSERAQKIAEAAAEQFQKPAPEAEPEVASKKRGKAASSATASSARPRRTAAPDASHDDEPALKRVASLRREAPRPAPPLTTARPSSALETSTLGELASAPAAVVTARRPLSAGHEPSAAAAVSVAPAEELRGPRLRVIRTARPKDPQ